VRTFFSPACHLYSLPAMVTLILQDSKGRNGLSRIYIGVTDESTAAEKSGIIRNGGDLELLHGVILIAVSAVTHDLAIQPLSRFPKRIPGKHIITYCLMIAADINLKIPLSSLSSSISQRDAN
jgi:hypothetical protein